MRIALPLTLIFICLATAGWLFVPSVPALSFAYIGNHSEREIYQRLEELGNDKQMGTLYDELQEAKANKISLDHRNTAGLRPLDLAASKDQGDAAAAFVVAGSNINSIDANGETVIHLAVRHHALKVLRELRHFMPQLDLRNKEGLTPADLARQLGDDQATAVLTGPLS